MTNFWIKHKQCFRWFGFHGWQNLFVQASLINQQDLQYDIWYVQNVSTLPNTFAIVSSLICVFWIQLTRTNAVFSRIAPMSYFCAKIWLSGKILENTVKFLFYQKTHGARRRDGEGLGSRLTTRGRGPGLAAPTYGEATLAASSSPPFAYIYPSTWNYRGLGVFPR
jgi:hypothetical protein